MKILIVLLVVSLDNLVYSFTLPRYTADNLNGNDPDVSRNVSEIIAANGYPVEDHVVQTADGFLLSVQRIPYSKDITNQNKRPVVFLLHGILSSSTDWVWNFQKESLGFILSDAGYDVWMGNIRGNTYSNRHVKLTPDMAAFWNYSFDQMAEYDLPAMIDYVLDKTGERQLIYIAHSQGTTAAFALLSENPLYNEKIKLFVALAPVATVGHITSVVKYFAPFTTEIDFVVETLGINEFLPNGAFLKFLNEEFCETRAKFLCENVMFYILGYDKSQVNETRIPVYFAHFPAGTSVKSVVHYGQLVNSGMFQKYDYGKHNEEYYNQTTPPEYDVSKITTPTALFWATNDNLADPDDVDLLTKKLKSLVHSYCVPNDEFNHGDFVLSIKAYELLYKEVLVVLHKYSNVQQ